MWILLIAALVWFAFGRHLMWGGGCARGRGFSSRRRSRLREWRRERAWRRRHGWTEADDEAWEKGRRSASGAEPRALNRPDLVEEAQRLWVQGRISDDEYEKRLDAVYSGSPRLL